MSEHSKLPWYVGASSDDKRIIVDGNGRYAATVQVHQTPRSAGEYDEDRRIANASLIVRSVNSHDKLVALLERALPFIDDAADAHSVMSETSLTKECLQVVADIKAALASVKGTSP